MATSPSARRLVARAVVAVHATRRRHAEGARGARRERRPRGRRILDDVTFFVPKGEFLCLCGPNGAGKSTLLKTILGP
ncbi:MAG: ATP-binding cassette domain-containing protein [Myxococcales bacterium]|nr:ATP-binding cassette domain-containing protein [Myxococcales bacterium]